jgi:hypothetical protein
MKECCMGRITDQVLCGFIISPKGFILSVLKANLTFLGPLENLGQLRSKVFHCRVSIGCRSFLSFICPSSAACQITSLASLPLESKRFKRSITCRYHITRARIFLSLTTSSPSSAAFFAFVPSSSYYPWTHHRYCDDSFCSYWSCTLDKHVFFLSPL